MKLKLLFRRFLIAFYWERRKKNCVVLRWAYSFMNTIMINDWRYAQKTKNITLEMIVWQANHMVLFVAYERSNVFLCVHEQYTRFVWFFRRMYEIVRALMISFIQILKSPICQSWALKNGNVHDYFILATNGRKQEKKKRERYVLAVWWDTSTEIELNDRYHLRHVNHMVTVSALASKFKLSMTEQQQWKNYTKMKNRKGNADKKKEKHLEHTR